MIIYIEGIDGSGKTTLSNALVARLNQLKRVKKIKIHADAESMVPTKPTHPKRITRNELFDKLMDMAQSTTDVYIMDRGPLSDIIYRMFDKYEPVMSLLDFTQFVKAANRRVVMVYCNTPKYYEYMMARGDDNPISVVYHKELRYMYDQILPVFDPVYFNLDKDGQLETINVTLARLWRTLDILRGLENDNSRKH